MGFRNFAHLSVQSTYEVRRTGLNRLSIIIEGLDEKVNNPRLLLNGDEAILVHDERNSIVLPEFPQQYLPELLQSSSVLVGEKEPPPRGPVTGLYSASRSLVRRFYEADVCLASEGTIANQTGSCPPAHVANLSNVSS
ncbi:MAG: hypothetical protein EOM26_05260 [Alphaproteobacteria bacterium]|nr:hypothetical protein [Alphaproteobacteria bacterium]